MLNIFQISCIKPPKQINNLFISEKTNYEFIVDNELYLEKCINEKCIGFENNLDIKFIDVFKNLSTYNLKKIFFMFFLLYTEGGIILDMTVVPKNKIFDIDLSKEIFICANSIVNVDELFLGILCSSKENPLIIELIKILVTYSIDKNVNKENITKHLFKKILELKKNNDKIEIFNEIKYSNNSNFVSTVNSNNEIILDNYFKHSDGYPIDYIDKKITCNKDIKIGITLNFFKEPVEFFSNGINQNALYLCELFLNAGFDAFFIVEDSKVFNVSDEKIKNVMYDSRFKLTKYSDILHNDMDLLITLSFSFYEEYLKYYFKFMKTKHVGYFCGNSYIIDSEKILYNQHKSSQSDKYIFTSNGQPKYDEIWSIPQMANTNLHYWKVLYRCKCIEIPFVWSPNAILLSSRSNGCSEDDLLYKNRGEEKKLAIFEPNISIMKWALPSIIISEHCYRENKKIKHLYINNIGVGTSINDFNQDQFNKYVCELDIAKDKKCSIEKRYNTLFFMKNFADIAVSHQWENPLNYLYFDLAWMGWPIVHNAYLCKDIGYFYNQFNYDEGKDALNNALNNHDKNINEYIKNNRKNMERFLTTNKELQHKYEVLVKEVLNISY